MKIVLSISFWLLVGICCGVIIKLMFLARRSEVWDKISFLDQNQSERAEKLLPKLAVLLGPLAPVLMCLLAILWLIETIVGFFRMAILKEKFSSLN